MSRRKSYNRGSCNPNYHKRAANWTGGRKIHGGYWLVWFPTHPLAQENGYILEHRLIIMNHLGRLLANDEVIHHKNGDKQDNRVENLEILARNTHSSNHNKGKVVSLETRKKLSLSCRNLHRSPRTEFKRGRTYIMGEDQKRKIGSRSRERMKKVTIFRDSKGRIVKWHS